VVAKLVHLKDPATALALEVTAGGRLYQVVVDSDATAKSLLQKGGLQKRVTIIPLNQVRGACCFEGVFCWLQACGIQCGSDVQQVNRCCRPWL
jgi:hypothetical protein